MLRTQITAESVAELAGFTGAQPYQFYTLNGNLSIGDVPPRFYYYDVNSVGVPDGDLLIGATGMGVGNFKRVYVESQKVHKTYSGVTNTAGVYSFNFPVPYSTAPNIQATITNGTTPQFLKNTISNSGFTITVQNVVNVLGLLPTYPNAGGVSVDVLITEK